MNLSGAARQRINENMGNSLPGNMIEEVERRVRILLDL